MSLFLTILDFVLLILYTGEIAPIIYTGRAELHCIRQADIEIDITKHGEKIQDQRIDVARKAYNRKYLDVLIASAAGIVSIAIWLAYEKVYKDKSYVSRDIAAILIISVSLNAVSNVVSSVFQFWLAKEEFNLTTEDRAYTTRKTPSLRCRSFYIICAALLLVITSYRLMDSNLSVSLLLFLNAQRASN